LLFYFIDLTLTKPGSYNLENSTRQGSTGSVNDNNANKNSFLAALHFIFSLISTIGLDWHRINSCRKCQERPDNFS
uniref:Uncharacterized protein n=1 Tax=Romanomermis culicivorax TaxID=13658 RepID=A0A915K997_ROMCU